MTERSTSAGASLLGLRSQGTWLRHRAAATAFLVLSAILIVSQQASFLLLKSDPDPFYRNVLNLGASYQRYFSFYYYYGGFPVNLENEKTRTRAEADATLAALGGRLTPERNVYNRASLFLFYPDAYWKGRPDTAEMRTGLAICFTVALLAVFAALCYMRLPIFGLLVALLCGSDPFQVYELYHLSSSTIFPTVISTGLLVLAICLFVAAARRPWHRVTALLLVAIAGVIGALQYEVRLEGTGVFIGALVCLVCCFPQRTITKVVCVCIFVASAYATNVALNRHFRASFEKANQVIAAHGGTPAASGDPYYATQWWALWSGLGDFDEKYGFLADDRAGLSYYYGHNGDQPSERVHRQNYISTVVHDPLWFAGIIRGRIARVLFENTPYRLAFGPHYVDIPVPPVVATTAGLLLVLAAGVLLGRHWLNLFILPLSVGLVAVGQLADYGLQFYAIAHLFLFAYAACFVLDGILLAVRRTAAAFIPSPRHLQA